MRSSTALRRGFQKQRHETNPIIALKSKRSGTRLEAELYVEMELYSA